MSVYLSESRPWRFVVTTLQGQTLTFLDKLASERVLHYELGGPSTASMRVPSDNPEINIMHTDGFPFLAEGVRRLFGWRREDEVGGAAPWQLRFAGIIMGLEDATGTDDATSLLTAYDPWQYCYAVPCLGVQPFGTYPLVGSEGIRYRGFLSGGTASPVDIIRDQISRIARPDEEGYFPANGTSVFATDWNTVGLREGDMTALDTIDEDYVITQDQTLGGLFTDLMSYAYCDITIDPVYDLNEPLVIGEINCRPKTGSYQPRTIFAWDLPSHNLVGVSRLIDGTQRANRIRLYAGKSGAPLQPAEDTNSEATYGVYEDQHFAVDVTNPGAYAGLQGLAAQEVQFRKNGQITYTVKPAAERAPRPFNEYEIGDWSPLYWSEAMREKSTLVQRFVGMTISVDDNGVETVEELLVVISDVDQPAGFPGGPGFRPGKVYLVPGGDRIALNRRFTFSGYTRPGRVGP